VEQQGPVGQIPDFSVCKSLYQLISHGQQRPTLRFTSKLKCMFDLSGEQMSNTDNCGKLKRKIQIGLLFLSKVQ